MEYRVYDVIINPLPDRQTYIDLFTAALATPSDAELEAATPASWTANPYRLWVLALARELKAYKIQQPDVLMMEADIVANSKYKSVNLGFKNKETNLEAFMDRWMALTIVLQEAVNCIYNGQPGSEVANPDGQVHLVIATTADGKYAGHITYYENEANPNDLVFIAIYKSVFCKSCPKFSEVLLHYIESKAKEMGKQTIHTRPIGPMGGILEKHGFIPRGAAYVKSVAATGGKRFKRSRNRQHSRSRSRKNRR
jgi:hypothetical protein